jgi:hypothetical protein
MHSTFAVNPALPAAERIRERLPRRLLKLRESPALCSIHPGP